MKNKFLYLTISFTLVTNLCLACVCNILETTTAKYLSADFAAMVKIVKTYKNPPEDPEYYQADVEIIDLYKGRTRKTIWIFGNNGGDIYSSCGVLVNEGQTILLFARTNNKKLYTGMCLMYFRPSALMQQVLNTLKIYAQNTTLNASLGTADYIPKDWYQIPSSNVSKNFSLVKLVITPDGKPNLIQHLTNDPLAFKEKLYTVLNQKMDWQKLSERLYKLNPKLSGKKITLFMQYEPYRYQKSMLLKM